jgi:hypothetical protein
VAAGGAFRPRALDVAWFDAKLGHGRADVDLPHLGRHAKAMERLFDDLGLVASISFAGWVFG